MQQFQHILVGVELDLSSAAEPTLTPASQDAVQQAIWLASHNGAHLTLATVLEDRAGRVRTDASTVAQRLAAAAARTLEQLVAQSAEQGISAKPLILRGRPWLELVRQVLRNRSDLVIVGTRGRDSLQDWLFGTTAVKLLRNCPSPVWVTRTPLHNDEPLDVLVATDLTDVGRQALHLGVDAAQLMDARLHVLHSVEHHLELQRDFGDLSDEEVERAYEAEVDEAERELASQISMTDYRTLTWGARISVVDGPPDQQILQTVESEGIELLVMGTVARGGIPGLLIGNTAERLLPRVNCSVLAVKPDDFVCQVSLED